MAMSDCFNQPDRAVHRLNFPLAHLHGTRSSTAGTITFSALLGCHFAGPIRLNHAAQSLAHFVGRDLNLVVVRRPRPLLDGLDLGGNISRLFEDFAEFFFEFCLFRVHAILPEV
jgi:hypothetical protein